MWALNLILPVGFLIFVLSMISMLDPRGTSNEPDEPAAEEALGDPDEAYAAPRGDLSHCRLAVTLVALLAGAALGCLLMGCLSARVSTFIVAFMLATLVMTCERIIPGN